MSFGFWVLSDKRKKIDERTFDFALLVVDALKSSFWLWVLSEKGKKAVLGYGF